MDIELNTPHFHRNSRAIESRNRWEEFRREIERKKGKSNVTGFSNKRNWPWFSILLRLFDLFIRIFGLCRRGNRNAKRIRLQELSLDFRNLPSSFDGYRILHLTDIHFDRLPGIEHIIGELIKSVPLDLVVMTGDYLDDMDGSPQTIQNQIKTLVEYLHPKDGILATLGNHDCTDLVPILDQSGVQVLVNETVEFRRSNETLFVTGLDDVHYYYSPQAKEALTASPKLGFKILLVHSPEIYELASQNNYSLYLTGHTHGGQVCTPLNSPIFTHVSTGRKYARGLWRRDNMTGYTSPGAGVSGLNVRYFCPPEITVITLRRR